VWAGWKRPVDYDHLHLNPFLEGWCHEEIIETLFLRREWVFLMVVNRGVLANGKGS
jgi:hypothetical protein